MLFRRLIIYNNNIMNIYLIIILFICLIFYKKYYFIENFFSKEEHRLKKCVELQSVISILFNINNDRINMFKKNINIHKLTRRKPILFYFWGSSSGFSGSNIFKNETMGPDLEGDNITTSAYGLLRQQIAQKFNNRFQYNKKPLFKNKSMSLFKQEYSDLKDILSENELNLIDENNYNKQNNLLRVIDMNVSCYYNNGEINTLLDQSVAHVCNSENNIDSKNTDCCCWIDRTSKNKGMTFINDTNKDECCHYLEYLRFIPESQFVIKIIYGGLYTFLENRLIKKKNDNKNIKIDDNLGDYTHLNDLLDEDKKIPIINTIPSFILWDGHGIDARQVQKGTILILGYNGQKNLKIPVPTTGDPTKFQFTSEIINTQQFKDFIKYHIHLYREDVTNFFEYLCLDFLKKANESNGNYAEGPGLYIVKNNKMTDYGYEICEELYKYHIRDEITYIQKEKTHKKLYEDFHYDYNTLTRYYGNNACNYRNMRLYYERFNIKYNWEIVDIFKFINRYLGDPYEILDKNYYSKLDSILGEISANNSLIKKI